MLVGGIDKGILLLGITLIVSKLGEDLARRVGLPGFIGALISGVLLGPCFMGVIDPSTPFMAFLIALGINFLLFLAGAEELSIVLDRRVGWRLVCEAVLVFSVPTILTMLSLRFIAGVPYYQALSIGVVMGIIGVGPVVKALMERGELGTWWGARVVAIGLLSEILGVLLFNASREKPAEILFGVISILPFLLALNYLGRTVLPSLLHYVERFSWAGEAPFAVIIALILTTGCIAEAIGFNAAIVSLVLGVFASNYLRERPEHLEKLRAFTYGFMEPLFFAGIGMRVSVISGNTLALALLITVSAGLSKLLIAKIAMRESISKSLIMLYKGGIDAALLASMLSTENSVLSGGVYSASVLAMLMMTLIPAIKNRCPFPHPPKHNLSFWGTRITHFKLHPAQVECNESLRKAAILLSEYPSIVVVRDGRPLGCLTQSDLIHVDPSLMTEIRVANLEPYKPIPIVPSTASILEAVRRMHEIESPAAAVVNSDGKLVGVVYARDILMELSKMKFTSKTRNENKLR